MVAVRKAPKSRYAVLSQRAWIACRGRDSTGWSLLVLVSPRVSMGSEIQIASR